MTMGESLWSTRQLLAGLLVLTTCTTSVKAQLVEDTLVSLVLEPFDVENVTDPLGYDVYANPLLLEATTGDEASIFPSNDTLFGTTSSLELLYNNDGTNTTDHTYTLSSILVNSSVFMCWGAQQVSFSYKHTLDTDLFNETDNDMTWTLSFFDKKGCEANCTEPENLEAWEYAGGLLTADDLWQTVTIPLGDDTTWALAADSPVLNGVLDLPYLKGWKLELTSATQGLVGTVKLAQISLDGPEEMLGAIFHADSYAEAIEDDVIASIYYNSNKSRDTTQETMANGTLSINYLLEQTETWGGFIQYDTSLSGRAFYNLTQVEAVSLWYHNLQASSVPLRAHLRFNALDTSDCFEGCNHFSPNVENYYSFHYIFDQPNRTDFVSIPLQGDDQATSPFYRTGWFGIVGNNKLDKAFIKGFKLEISLDSQGGVGSVVKGAFELSNLKALRTYDSSGSDTSQCVVETGVYYRLGGKTQFNRIEFLTFSQCCDACMSDETCNFAWSDGRDCYKTNYVYPEDIALIDDMEFSKFVAFSKRAISNYCDVCECRESTHTVDCRGKNLILLPGTFQQEVEGWEPRTLDLRNNPRLAIMSREATRDLPDLEELRLPPGLVHIPQDSFAALTKLKSVTFEESTEDVFVNNVVTTQDGFFSEVCCGLGETFNFAPSSPVEYFTFCAATPDRPGIDADYIDFMNYFEASPVAVLTPSSSFMSEAAETVQKCAEFCNIRSDCLYFTYDGRVVNAEHVCLLLSDTGTPTTVCCATEQYADVAQTLPGYVSGRVPRSRALEENARVLLRSGTKLTASESSKYTVSYQVELGSMPKRGAVWVEPKIISSSDALMDILVTPPRVAFYDNETTHTIEISASGNLGNGGTIVVENRVRSCDKAFSLDLANLTVVIDVVVPQESNNKSLWISVGVSAGFLVFIIVFFIFYMERKKKQADSVWHVETSELTFADPVKVIGSGSFGLVVLAEYRGTDVAVKRVIPPRKKGKRRRKGSTGSSTMKAVSIFDTGSADGNEDSQSGDETTSGGEDYTNSGSHSAIDIELGVAPQGSLTGGGIFSSAARAHQGKQWAKAFEYKKADHDKLKERFIEEMRYLSKMRHPCITTVMGAVINRNEEPMLIMEYMDLGSLHDLLRNETVVLDGEQVLLILKDIAQGMRFLHAANPQVLHGDLKARNILVDSRLRAKVADFGLGEKKRLGATGTPYWMAPELLRGETTNTATSDVYAFGITLYEVYSRKDPFKDEDFVETIELISDKAAKKRPPIPDGCPHEIADLMKQCVDEDPEKRPTFKALDLKLKTFDAAMVEPQYSAKGPRISLSKAKQGTESLLDEVFPPHVAKALKEGRKVEPESKEMVSIFFSDIVGFTNISATISAMAVSDMLDRLYMKFDEISHIHDVFKVETIGDSWMGVTNLVKEQQDHADRIAAFALDAMRAAHETLVDPNDPGKGTVNLRVGFHSGPVVANVVGSRNPRYCLFGDTVNTASRMESHSLPGRIQCSSTSAEQITNRYANIKLTPRGKILVKGKGKMDTFFVDDISDKRSEAPETAPPELALDRDTRVRFSSIKSEHSSLSGEFLDEEVASAEGIPVATAEAVSEVDAFPAPESALEPPFIKTENIPVSENYDGPVTPNGAAAYVSL